MSRIWKSWLQNEDMDKDQNMYQQLSQESRRWKKKKIKTIYQILKNCLRNLDK